MSAPNIICPRRTATVCETPTVCEGGCRYNNDPIHPNRTESFDILDLSQLCVEAADRIRRADAAIRRLTVRVNELREKLTDTERLRYVIVEGIIAEMDDPRNRVEHPGFRDGMQRALTIVDIVCQTGKYQP
jgi:hypothetical protein